MVSIQKHSSNINTGQLLNGLMFAQNILQQTGIMGSVWQWQDVLNPQSYMYTSGFNTSAFGTSTFGTSTFDSSETSSASTKNKSVTKSKSQTKSETKSDTKSETVSETESDEKIKDEINKKAVEIINKEIKAHLENEEEKKLLADVVKKYTLIKEGNPNISDAELATRMENYIRGSIYHLKETKFGLQGYAESVGEDYGYSNEVISDERVAQANANNDLEAYKAAYHKQAQEYIEYYDDNNNGKVEENEFIRKEVASLTEMLGGEELNAEEGNEIQKEAKIKIKTFDKNNDNELDENEISAYLWARSNWHLNGNELTYEEYMEYETAIGTIGYLSKDDKRDADACSAILSKYDKDYDIRKLPEDLSTLGLTPEEIEIVEKGLPALKIIFAKEAFENGYDALYTKLDKE